MSKQSKLEREFAYYWKALAPQFLADPPAPRRQYRFHPERRWKADFAWPRQRVIVEVDGGAFLRRRSKKTGKRYSGGGHHSAAGYRADRERDNAAVAAGWLVLRYTSKMLNDDPWAAIEQVCTVLEQRLDII